MSFEIVLDSLLRSLLFFFNYHIFNLTMKFYFAIYIWFLFGLYRLYLYFVLQNFRTVFWGGRINGVRKCISS